MKITTMGDDTASNDESPTSGTSSSTSGDATDPTVAAFVSDFLRQQLRQSGHEWRGGCATAAATTTDEPQTRVGAALRALADEFTMQFKEELAEMYEQLDISHSTLRPLIVGAADELFGEGIKWVRIVALFVFGKELALACTSRGLQDSVATVAAELAAYITQKLLPWINDHGGWEGLVTFKEGEASEVIRKNKGWPSMKNVLCLSLGAVGALAIGAIITNS